jgi:hypothetical protein
MANEYLQRTPTSTGNRRVFTWSGWIKKQSNSGAIFNTNASSSYDGFSIIFNLDNADDIGISCIDGGTNQFRITTLDLLRDNSSWFHLLVAFDTTLPQSNDRVKLYVNGVQKTSFNSNTRSAPINYNFVVNQSGKVSYIGRTETSSGGAGNYSKNEFADVFFIDGQALTPDVFGFNKPGKGYISVGSTQSTDFRPGQWVPKTPRVIKTAINNNGGFGVNGFYLPMNDSNNFGADFHGTPNSIIKLQENLPQPRCRIDGVGDYTGALRDDPFKQYLVLALPFVSGGLQSGFGDYSAAIKGSGSAKTLVWNSGSVTPSIGNTGVYYGSGGNFPGGTVGVSTSTDFKMDGSFTVESWFFSNNFNSGNGNHIVQYRNGLAGSDNWVLSQGGTGGGSIRFLLRNDNGTNAADLDITSTGITTNQWYHFAGVYNDTNKTSTVYLNGVTIGIATNISWTRNNGTTLLIGSNGSGPTGAVGDRNINGYLQDLRIYKGVAKYTGGFDVPRPYTPVGIATWRAVPDTTANNFATLNPLDRARNTGTQTDGNLSTATNTGNYTIRSTVGVSTGKWYWEFCTTAASNTNHHGIVAIGRSMGTFYLGETLDSWGIYDNNGNKRNNGSFDSYGTGFSQYDVGMVALDKSNGKIWWGKNGTWFASGNPSNATNEAFSNINIVCSGIGTDSFVSPSQLQFTSCSYNFGQNPTFSGNTTAGTFTDTNGKGLFKYQPPSGFLALCEDNLPTPAIANPGRHFRTVLYTGDGASGRSITGIGFTPDLVWIKSRSNAYNHGLQDSVRGIGKVLYSNLTNTEDTGSVSLTSFDSNGFGIGNDSWNGSGITYVAWCWKAGAGTTSTNTNGSITSVVSVNQDAGFSIVSYTGNATVSTVGHGLGKAPAFIIVKGRTNAVDWQGYHKSLGINYTTFLNLTNASSNISNYWGSSNPTSTNFGITGSYSGVNSNGVNYIAYCWAEIEGYSKFGSYNGNNSTDGVFVYTGHRPAFVMIKRTDSTGNWVMHDNARNSTNPAKGYLLANSSGVEEAGSDILDFLSNGFKIRNTWTDINASGGTYIFAAFAESPFQTANSK